MLANLAIERYRESKQEYVMSDANYEPLEPELNQGVPIEPALQAIVVHGANLILQALLEQSVHNDMAGTETERTAQMMPRIQQAAQQAIKKLQADSALSQQLLRIDDDRLREIQTLHSLFGLTSLTALARTVKKEPSFVVEALHQINAKSQVSRGTYGAKAKRSAPNVFSSKSEEATSSEDKVF